MSLTTIGAVLATLSTPETTLNYQELQNYCNSISFDSAATSSNSTYYGSAQPYVSFSNESINCFGYAIEKDVWGEIDFFYACTAIDLSMFYGRVVNAVIQSASGYGVTLRYLDSLNTQIYSNERRIAFRIRMTNNTYGGFHFMKQHSDGSWGHKMGSLDNAQYNTAYNNTPDYDSAWWYSSTLYYDSPTLYYAVR